MLFRSSSSQKCKTQALGKSRERFPQLSEYVTLTIEDKLSRFSAKLSTRKNPKSWCGLFDPGVSSVAYKGWHQQLKAYMTARKLDPGHLTDTQVDAITVFARALMPVKDQVVLIKKKHHPDDVKEFTRQLRMLVKDSARELHTSNLPRLAAARPGGRDIAESPSK